MPRACKFNDPPLVTSLKYYMAKLSCQPAILVHASYLFIVEIMIAKYHNARIRFSLYLKKWNQFSSENWTRLFFFSFFFIWNCSVPSIPIKYFSFSTHIQINNLVVYFRSLYCVPTYAIFNTRRKGKWLKFIRLLKYLSNEESLLIDWLIDFSLEIYRQN